MNKELTALETLERLKLFQYATPNFNKPFKIYPHNPYENFTIFVLGETHKEQFNIIETALKESEGIKNGSIRISVEHGENYVAMPKYQYEQDLKKLKTLEIIKELLNLKVIELLPNNNDTRLFVNCGNFKASVMIPPKYIDLLKEVLL